ncbi:hypothetical protein ACWEO2_25080 [Nocardia sp. NPDC004278]
MSLSKAAQSVQHFVHSAYNAGQLEHALRWALKLPTPPGDAGQIARQAEGYHGIATRLAELDDTMQIIHTIQLPAAWRGKAAENAGTALKAIAADISACHGAFQSAGDSLQKWSSAVGAAVATDGQGRALVTQALRVINGRPLLSGKSLGQAMTLAHQGCDCLVQAAQQYDAAATTVARDLTEFAANARAHLAQNRGVRWIFGVQPIDPLSAVTLAYSTPGLLTPNALDLAGQRYAALPADQRDAFERMLEQSRSPMEAGILWKALAAGNSLDVIRLFEAEIHPHGSDTNWLVQHLIPPLYPKFGSKAEATYKGVAIFDQGDHGDCVAASTVVARAMNDPVYMLGLTTGFGKDWQNNPPKGVDTPAAVQTRLQNTYLAMDDHGWGGGHSNALANEWLSGPAGGHYSERDIDTSATRSAALKQIEGSVDMGKPVVVHVYEDAHLAKNAFHDSHQMMIIGHHGDQLEIYNPWGFTQWVPETDFVEGKLGYLTNGHEPVPREIDVPQ